jgi:beta-lactamase class C
VTLAGLGGSASAADSVGDARPASLSPGSRNADAAVRDIKILAPRVIDKGKVTGMSIAIVHDGEVLLEQGFGVTEVGSKDAVSEETVFRLASLSKSFAGAVAAQLVDEGALRWDSRIADQLPALKLPSASAAAQLTVLNILSHQVGLAYNTLDRDLEAEEPYPLLVAKLGDAKALCQPGDCYSYQNIAFSLIGDMVFAVTGDVYSYQAERRLFHPLGMYNSTFGRDALEASASWARPHVRRSGRWVAVRPKETYYRVPPAAGANASARDMSLWMLAQLGERPDVLSPDLLDVTHRGQVATPGEKRGGSSSWRRARIDSAEYAIGWRLYDYAGEELVFHAGAVQGYRGMLGMLPHKRFGIVILWNCESGAPSGLMATALDRMLGLPDRDWTGLAAAPKSGRRR